MIIQISGVCTRKSVCAHWNMCIVLHIIVVHKPHTQTHTMVIKFAIICWNGWDEVCKNTHTQNHTHTNSLKIYISSKNCEIRTNVQCVFQIPNGIAHNCGNIPSISISRKRNSQRKVVDTQNAFRHWRENLLEKMLSGRITEAAKTCGLNKV